MKLNTPGMKLKSLDKKINTSNHKINQSQDVHKLRDNILPVITADNNKVSMFDQPLEANEVNYKSRSESPKSKQLNNLQKQLGSNAPSSRNNISGLNFF
jgi:hypothetical protein